ncbi:MAG: Adenylate cyclase 2 [Chloroflexi bacterium]|nr:Adenylate cyclase 2 [Chloroflexota bacterium]
MYKTDPSSQPFTKTDLELTTAISHQAALTIQRVNLINQFHDEQKLRQVFQRFISPHEVDFFMDEYRKDGSPPALTQKYISILFIDIADSTGLAEDLGPQRFGDLLNHYYIIATDIIFQNKGVVRYIGDGILAVFGMTEESANHENRAVKTGFKILEDISSLQENFQTPILFGCGVNTGEAMVGYVGPQQRLEFTVLGDVVNTAHGLQLHARPNRLFIGNNTYQAIKEKYQARKLHPIKLKGRTHSVEVYEIIE